MPIAAHLKSYLRQSSVHGLPHLVDRSDDNVLVRLAWIAAILATFLTLPVIIYNTQRDFKEAPVATTSDFVPIQEVPFPAVSLSSSPIQKTRYPSELLSQLEFDCSQYNLDEEGKKCMERTGAVRKALKPEIRRFIQFSYGNLTSHFADSYTDRETDLKNFIKAGICYFMASNQANLEFLKYYYDENRYIVQLLEALEDIFMTPRGTIGKFLHQFNDNITTSTDHGPSPGSDLPAFNDKVCYTTLWFETARKPLSLMIILYALDLSSKVPFQLENNNVVLPEQLLFRLQGNATGDDFIQSSKSVLQYVRDDRADCTGQDNGDVLMCFKSRRSMCCKAEAVTDYRQVLKILKYTQEADAAHMRYKSDINDIQIGLQKQSLTEKLYAMKHDKPSLDNAMFQSDPVILGCDYGKVSLKMSVPCSLFQRFPTADGLHYVFNPASFWSIFYNDSWSMDYYKELIQHNKEDKTDHVLKPLYNGQGYSLRFLLRQPNDLNKRPEDKSVRSIAIHHPKSMGPLTADGIEILPGNHYSILVTPTIIQTKEDILNLTPAKRGCISQSDPKILKLFASYTYENCLFECQLNSAFDKCGCIPWDYPRLGNDVPICTFEFANNCFLKALLTNRDPTYCSQCLIDCDTVTYSYNVLTNNINVAKYCAYSNNTPSEITRSVLQTFKNPIGNLKFIIDEKEIANYFSDNTNSYDNFTRAFCQKTVRQKLSHIEVYMAPIMAMRITRHLRMTFPQQLADIGGVLSLFTGMSLLSIFELIMWCCKIPQAMSTNKKKRIYSQK